MVVSEPALDISQETFAVGFLVAGEQEYPRVLQLHLAPPDQQVTELNRLGNLPTAANALEKTARDPPLGGSVDAENPDLFAGFEIEFRLPGCANVGSGFQFAFRLSGQLVGRKSAGHRRYVQRKYRVSDISEGLRRPGSMIFTALNFSSKASLIRSTENDISRMSSSNSL